MNFIKEFMYLSPREKKEILHKKSKQFVIFSIIFVILSFVIFQVAQASIADTGGTGATGKSEVEILLKESENIAVEDIFTLDEETRNEFEEQGQLGQELTQWITNSGDGYNFANGTLTQTVLTQEYDDLADTDTVEGQEQHIILELLGQNSPDVGPTDLFKLLKSISKSIAVIALMLGALLQIIKLVLGKRANLQVMIVNTLIAFFILSSFSMFYVEGLGWLDKNFVTPFLSTEGLSTSMNVIPISEYDINLTEYGEEVLQRSGRNDMEGLRSQKKDMENIKDNIESFLIGIGEIPNENGKKLDVSADHKEMIKDQYVGGNNSLRTFAERYTTNIKNWENFIFFRGMDSTELNNRVTGARVNSMERNIEKLDNLINAFDTTTTNQTGEEINLQEVADEIGLSFNPLSDLQITNFHRFFYENLYDAILTLITLLVVIISQMIFFVLVLAREAYLVFFALVGPIYLALAPIEGVDKLFKGWVASVAQVWFWGILLGIFLNMQNLLFTRLYSISDSFIAQFLLIIYGLVIMFMMFQIPKHVPKIMRGNGGAISAAQTAIMTTAATAAGVASMGSAALGGGIAATGGKAGLAAKAKGFASGAKTGLTGGRINKANTSKMSRGVGKTVSGAGNIASHGIGMVGNKAGGKSSTGRIGGHNFGISNPVQRNGGSSNAGSNIVDNGGSNTGGGMSNPKSSSMSKSSQNTVGSGGSSSDGSNSLVQRYQGRNKKKEKQKDIAKRNYNSPQAKEKRKRKQRVNKSVENIQANNYKKEAKKRGIDAKPAPNNKETYSKAKVEYQTAMKDKQEG